MIKANSLEELETLLEKASKKADKLNPQIEIIEAGLYHVKGSKPDVWYEVRCGRTEDGQFFIACTCRGGLEGKSCYHASKAFYKHKSLKSLEIRLRGNQEMDNAPLLKPSSEKKPEKLGDIRV